MTPADDGVRPIGDFCDFVDWACAMDDRDRAMQELEARLDDVNLKDSVKTREINILTKENRELLAALAKARQAQDALRAVVEHAAKMGERAMHVCRAHGYVFKRFPRDMEQEPPQDDGERWEALAFSFYTDIAEVVSKAGVALDEVAQLFGAREDQP